MDYFWYWTEHTLFHWDFWLSWFFAILPWILWYRYHKKENRGRQLLGGFLALIISSWLDFIGVSTGLWYYTGLTIPTIPSYVPWDFCIIPVFVMFLLEFKPEASVYWKAAIFAGVSSFVGEPLFLWLGFYIALYWNLLLSVPIYFLLFLLCYRISRIPVKDPIR